MHATLQVWGRRFLYAVVILIVALLVGGALVAFIID